MPQSTRFSVALSWMLLLLPPVSTSPVTQGEANANAPIEMNSFRVTGAVPEHWTGLRTTLTVALGNTALDLSAATQVARGQTTEITFWGNHFEAIDSVEITPPEGVSVQSVKELETSENGWKRWSLVVSVDKTARPGERTLVVVTPQGRSKAETLRIATHVPKISDLRVASVRIVSSETSMGPYTRTEWGPRGRFTFSLVDPAGDIGRNPSIYVVLNCGGEMDMVGWATSPQQIVKADAQNSVVNVSLARGTGSTQAAGRFSQGSLPSGTCEMGVLFADARGYYSNWLTATVELK